MPKRLVNSLPFDFSRCSPTEPDAHCRSCARYCNVEGQTWGGRTPCFLIEGSSTSEGCRYIPATHEEIEEIQPTEDEEEE